MEFISLGRFNVQTSELSLKRKLSIRVVGNESEWRVIKA